MDWSTDHLFGPVHGPPLGSPYFFQFSVLLLSISLILFLFLLLFLLHTSAELGLVRILAAGQHQPLGLPRSDLL